MMTICILVIQLWKFW